MPGWWPRATPMPGRRPRRCARWLRALRRDDLALRFRFQADPQFWRWCWRFARQCTRERAAYNTRRKVALCLYSQRSAASRSWPRPASPMAAAPAAPSTSTATPQGLRRGGRQRADPARRGCRGPRGHARRGGGARPGLRAGPRPVRRCPLRAGRRERRCPAVHPRPRRLACASAGVDVPPGRGGRADRIGGGRVSAASSPTRASSRPTPTSWPLGCWSAGSAAALGLDLPDLPDQGLLGDPADRGPQQPAHPLGRRRGQSVRLRQLRRPGAA